MSGGVGEVTESLENELILTGSSLTSLGDPPMLHTRGDNTCAKKEVFVEEVKMQIVVKEISKLLE